MLMNLSELVMRYKSHKWNDKYVLSGFDELVYVDLMNNKEFFWFDFPSNLVQSIISSMIHGINYLNKFPQCEEVLQWAWEHKPHQ